MNGKKKRKLWHEDSIAYAINLVHDEYSVNKAAKETGIPETTLRLRIKTGQLKPTGFGPILDSEGEEELEKYICFMSNIGHPVTPKWIRQTAGRFASKR